MGRPNKERTSAEKEAPRDEYREVRSIVMKKGRGRTWEIRDRHGRSPRQGGAQRLREPTLGVRPSVVDF
jgi:hypothetical protein